MQGVWCLVDSGFAHIKNRYRNHDCETLEQLTALVDQSSVTRQSRTRPGHGGNGSLS
ncbi:hypothetical protein DPMN_182278 [Dreissena polymorpha]|uniref:Uncharacterized protein n=1 Tax=Dreissena polymorpha TaxID=45954 RepID=A0A9D4DF64_DREPO|nr:hypothetical protein DPMN_182278 [Dreissena polymorpha]